MKYPVLPLAIIAVVAAFSEGGTPVAKIVDLLQGVAEKLQEEFKNEQDAYQKYQCWAKQSIADKKAEEQKANARRDTLTQYIADLNSGRITLTSERSDLTKEVDELSTGLENMKALRTKEQADFEAAEAELNKAITALGDAIDVLNKGMGNLLQAHPNGNFLSTRSALQKAHDSESLAYAIQFGHRFLSQSDARFLENLLSGRVPKAEPDGKDWKKLNEKATWKEKYTARSGKILEVLKKLLADFQTNLRTASDANGKAITTFTQLSAAKAKELSDAQAALAEEDKENGAKGLAKSDAQDEIGDLDDLIIKVKQYQVDVDAALTTKQGEWVARKAAREDELQAVSKAISILHADESRDIFRRSEASQSFLQLDATSSDRQVVGRAVRALKDAGMVAGDQRLLALAARVSEGSTGRFDAVLQAIDTMKGELDQADISDQGIKQNCETNHKEYSSKAMELSRKIDAAEEDNDQKRSDIKAGEEKIAQNEADVAKNIAAIEEADALRKKENLNWQATDKDDKDAHALVLDAINALNEAKISGCDKAGALLQQVHRHGAKQPLEGEPDTWKAAYGGNANLKMETGICELLSMAAEDIKKDMAAAFQEETDAVTAYNKLTDDLRDANTDLNADTLKLRTANGVLDAAIAANKVDQRADHRQVESYVGLTDGLAKNGCNFMAMHFEERKTKRQAERDGLDKAKQILEGFVDLENRK